MCPTSNTSPRKTLIQQQEQQQSEGEKLIILHKDLWSAESPVRSFVNHGLFVGSSPLLVYTALLDVDLILHPRRLLYKLYYRGKWDNKISFTSRGQIGNIFRILLADCPPKCQIIIISIYSQIIIHHSVMWTRLGKVEDKNKNQNNSCTRGAQVLFCVYC